jgi:hypothetical protein
VVISGIAGSGHAVFTDRSDYDTEDGPVDEVLILGAPVHR